MPPDPARPRPDRSSAAGAGPGATLLAGFGILVCGGLAALALAFPPDGDQRGGTAEFFGRFHPVIVHLPIGLLLLVPVLELAGRRRGKAHLAEAAGFVAGCGAAAAVVAAAAGWLLGRSGGYVGPEVISHMWAGIAVAALAVATAWVRGRFRGPAGRRIHAVLGAATLGLLVWTGHQGGGLTHGGNYLTERMPDRLRHWLGLPPAPPPPPVPPAPPRVPVILSPGYAAAVAPLLQRSCVSCHRPDKHKGGLRMDTYVQLMKGGEDGRAVIPGKPKDSELIRRVTLPSDDDDFMPSDGKHPLSPAEIRLIRRWIAAGAAND